MLLCAAAQRGSPARPLLDGGHSDSLGRQAGTHVETSLAERIPHQRHPCAGL